MKIIRAKNRKVGGYNGTNPTSKPEPPLTPGAATPQDMQGVSRPLRHPEPKAVEAPPTPPMPSKGLPIKPSAIRYHIASILRLIANYLDPQ